MNLNNYWSFFPQSTFLEPPIFLLLPVQKSVWIVCSTKDAGTTAAGPGTARTHGTVMVVAVGMGRLLEGRLACRARSTWGAGTVHGSRAVELRSALSRMRMMVKNHPCMCQGRKKI